MFDEMETGNAETVAEVSAGTATSAKETETASGAPELKYTEADISAIHDSYNKKIQEETVKAVSEALKKAKMSPEEKAKTEAQEKEEALTKRERDITLRELKNSAAAILSEKGLPAEAVEFILGEDEKATKERIDAFKAMFDSSLQKYVDQRLVGKEPAAGRQKPTGLTREEVEGMTPEQIADRWDDVQDFLKNND